MFDPAADFYANHVPTCAYSSMRELKRLDGGTFSFPLRVLAYQGEQLSGQSFDTVSRGPAAVSGLREHADTR